MESILEHLEYNAAQQPDKIAFEVLGTPNEQITYQQVEKKVNWNAHHLL